MTSPPSGSDASEGFGRLHHQLQRWIWQRGWTSLHDAQERAIGPILDGRADVIISAATAAGKTEAAFLPICSALASTPGTGGVEVLYVSPLKALINDQHTRLDELGEAADVPVHRWHGDVSSSAKQRVLRSPRGVLLITPESLEAIFARRGTEVSTVFAGLRYVVVDELHAFIGTPRGAQLQSLLHRVELAIRRRPPRIGLSATLGDMGLAAEFLRPGAAESVVVIVSESDGQEIQLQVRGYRRMRPKDDGSDTEEDAADAVAITDHLFATLRGDDNLVFANRREDVELYADLLARRSESAMVPNEFWPHHGSLSKELREDVEAALKDPTRPTTAVCTSTLEMGIDIGSVRSVGQLGPPPTVAALRQRLGRSGRRGVPAIMRVYVTELELDGQSSILDELRDGLVQTIAMVRLLLARWVESPDDPGLNLSTLIQQVLSVIAQHGGAMAIELHRALCIAGPFGDVDERRFLRLLRAMAAGDLLVQAGDDTLLHGVAGERAVNHYSFYTAFPTPQEWRLFADGSILGTLPISYPLIEGGLLIFGGRRWRITRVDPADRVIELARTSGGRPPMWGGRGPTVDDRVRAEMVAVYRNDDVPSWLDVEAARLLAEGREAWRRWRLEGCCLLGGGAGVLVVPWLGDRALLTAGLALRSTGLDFETVGPVLGVADCSVDGLVGAAQDLLERWPVTPTDLARQLEAPEIDKWDHVLDDDLAAEANAARLLDVEGGRAVFEAIVEDRNPIVSASRR